MRMLRVELSRLRSRRAVVLLLLAAALLSAFVAGATVLDTRPVTAEERAAAVAEVERLRQDPAYVDQQEACEADPERYLDPGATAADCEVLMPSVDDFLVRSPLSLADEVGDSGLVVLLVVLPLLAVAGTTFAGADWNTRSMSNQLLFEPRRGRVWSAKAAAVTLVGAGFTAVVVGGFWAVLYAVARSRGLDVSAQTLQDVATWGARGVALGAGAALGGYALTMLLRSTVATMATLFAYAVAGEPLLALLPVPELGRWSLTFNTLAWLRGEVAVYDRTLECSPTDMDCSQTFVLTMGQAAVFFVVLLAVVSALSLVLFRRRDIP